MPRKFAVTIALLCVFHSLIFSQVQTNSKVLANLAKQYRETEDKSFQTVLSFAAQKGWPLKLKTKSGGIASLIGIDDFGLPIYYTTENNIIAAATTRTNLLWPGGSLNLNLSGSSANVKNKMAIWDGGKILPTHVELTGRISQRDNPLSFDDHSTHVAGTLIAAGINPAVKGMAFGLQGLAAYDFNNDVSEMSGEAANLVLSNHSYGTIAGWFFNSDSSRWEFWGRFNENEDYKFGYYDTKSQLWDSIAYNAPYYLVVKSVGNNRSENGPAVGQPYYRYNANNQMTSAGARPAGISNNDSYEIVSGSGGAKNILTVGAVNGLPYGYSRKEDVVLSNFSSWGPTDDGRIKPDVVADGINITSSVATSDNAYATFSGTSMSTPNVTGSLLLLQEYYSQLHPGVFMRSATLKALAIHTADESGPADGPDYQYGWGLLNVAKAATVIQSNNTGSHLIYENVLNNGGTFSTTVIASGQGPLVATLAWTDPKGSVDNVNMLNNHTRKLVDDLDVRITKGPVTYQPWILDPNNPSAAATRGDNVLDNVERINVNDIIPGQAYTISVTHKGVLERGSQAYSLIISGAGGQAYCASAPTSNTGTRIDNVSFGSIQQANPAGCTTYTNYTGVSTTIQANQALPITVNVSSCDGSITNKIIKVYIDYNNNGVFTDPGELVATSGVLNGTAIFTASIQAPASLVQGNSSILRIVAQQTTDPSVVNPCGNYSNGETQDYKITFASPSSDLSVVELTAPGNSACSNPSQLVVIKIKNNGTISKTNVPVSVIIKNGAATVATLNAIYPDVIDPSAVVTYTFQAPFTSVAGVTYSFSAIVSAVDDQNRSNDTLKSNVTIPVAPSVPSGSAEICGATALLHANATGAANYFWYATPALTNSIATGANTSTTVIPASNTYYLATGAAGTVGLASKSAFPNGGGYLTSTSANFMKYSATVPVTLETARLYTKYHGAINFIVANILSVTGTSYTYQTLSSTTVDVYATSPNPAPGVQAVYDAADTGATFYLNLSLPAGDHAIIIQPVGDANLFRNNNVTGSPYPFTLPNVISFTGNSATLATDPNYFQGFYYFLYNMKVRTSDCISAATPIIASVAVTPTISMVNDSLVSSANSANQWNLNGVGITGATDKKYKPTQSGNYTVVVTSSSGCQLTSAPFNFVLTSITPVDAQEIELKLSPNPNNGSFALSFKVDKKTDLLIDVINTQGQSCYKKIYPGYIGNFSQQFNLRRLAAGVYVIKIQQGNKIYYKKIVIDGN